MSYKFTTDSKQILKTLQLCLIYDNNWDHMISWWDCHPVLLLLKSNVLRWTDALYKYDMVWIYYDRCNKKDIITNEGIHDITQTCMWLRIVVWWCSEQNEDIK